MRIDILDAWARIQKVVQLKDIVRIGLRYINRIKRTHDETVGDWLASSNYIPKSVLSSLPGFLSRLEIRPEEYRRLIVNIGDIVQPDESSQSAILMDIDCINGKKIGINDEKIIREIIKLHDDVWNIFSVSLTPRLEKLLKGG